jgi:hypothetical protein
MTFHFNPHLLALIISLATPNGQPHRVEQPEHPNNKAFGNQTFIEDVENHMSFSTYTRLNNILIVNQLELNEIFWHFRL